MASSLSTIAAKDGAAATITGGILAVDKSGAGTGPFFQAQTIVDTQGVNTATVKAASTAPVATDTAIVVALSPNSVNANGSAAAANSAPVTASTEDVARVGIITETAPASDTASSGLNGRLQRIAQNITSLIAATLKVNLVPATTGGLTISSTLIAAGTNATSVKASAGQLYKVEITNNSANIGYLKLYNTAGTPTAGSGTPVIRLMVPGNASGTGTLSTYDNGVAFATGIGFTFTGGIADADTTSVAASAFIVNLYYK